VGGKYLDGGDFREMRGCPCAPLAQIGEMREYIKKFERGIFLRSAHAQIVHVSL